MRGAGRVRVLFGLVAAALVAVAACGGAKSTQAGGADGGGVEGETIRIVVPFGPGGSYDIIARAAAPYLEEELGATVVVENEDGAGGLLAANEVFAAEPDGLTIGFFSAQGIAGADLGAAEGAQFDVLDYTYIGRVSADPRVIVTGPNGEYRTIQELLSGSDVTFATAGTGGADHIDATVLIPTLGIPGRIVSGYEGSDDTGLALASGDVDIGSGTVSSRLPDIKAGDLRPLLIVGDEPVDKLPGVPTVTDLDLAADDLAMAQAHLRLQALGAMLWAPPGMAEELRSTLEDAFEAACENPEFLEAMEEDAYQEIDFTAGAEAKELAAEVMNAPDDYKALLEDAFENQ